MAGVTEGQRKADGDFILFLKKIGSNMSSDIATHHFFKKIDIYDLLAEIILSVQLARIFYAIGALMDDW